MKSPSSRIFAIAISFLAAQAASMADPSAPRTPAWYADSFIHTHHSAGVFAPEWEIQLQAVRPDAVQFHTSAYREGKRLSEAHGFALVCTLNRAGHWKDVDSVIQRLPKAEQKKAFFARVNPDGSPAGRMRDGRIVEHLCLYSPGIDTHILPIYADTSRRFEPAQIWIDHNVITVNLCYCPACRAAFKARENVDPPESGGDPKRDEWVTYHRAGFEVWMRKVCETVASNCPSTMVTFNHAYFITQPEPPPSFVRNLSADIHGQPLYMGLFARYASTVGLPFDIMPGLTDRWAGTKAKPLEEVLQAAAIITANGGRWNIGEFPASRDRQPADAMLKLAAAGAEFVRARQAWTHKTDPVPLIAILQSASTQYARVIPRARPPVGAEQEHIVSDSGLVEVVGKGNPGTTRIYWHDNRAAPLEVTGAGEALLENNLPFDIINDATLNDRLGDYKILIVGDQFRLDDDTVAAIRRFVENGGGLLATGRTIETGLADVIGARTATATPVERATVQWGDSPVEWLAPLPVKPDGAEIAQSFRDFGGRPAVVRRRLGKGRVLYVAADVFRTFMESSPYTSWSRSRAGHETMRRAVADWIAELAPDLSFACSAPPWIEVALRRKGPDLLVQLVDRSFEWRKTPRGESQPVELALRTDRKPERVTLQPGDRTVEWVWRDGAVRASIPLESVQTHSILELPRSRLH